MPIIPDPETFPAASQKGSNEPQTKSEEKPKASALDHISKGPQIPDEMPPKASHEEIEERMKELNKSKKD
ncbi:uncharacterized protein N7484_001109 [Penicillium longicatenatum]|uniref:uncharacterized protein n=1 Tax=Penicillium longicatenatum TaxID=1561947 RepID=UPI00254870EE|nr:uncharacterized protein N7484_001109 [Penicillium longicatenatum]KAJ5657460.1 hypothetical protein N7484_001109 [Penicillium longicatenatum]KAJ5663137.1 hypothetical protein N7507_003868 [Penicillium longicatenatum]